MNDPDAISLFRELITCGDELYSWKYNRHLDLISSNCPQEYLFDIIFRNCEFHPSLIAHAQTGNSPLVLSVQLGLVWIAAFEKCEGKLTGIHVIGPAMSSIVSTEKISQLLGESYPADASLAYKWEIAKILENLPVISSLILTRYALMLHYCVTGSKLSASDISMLRGTGFASPELEEPFAETRSIWMIEEDLYNKVRTGDLQYRQALSRATFIQSSFAPHFKDPLRQRKTMAIFFISLCMRAATDGGLPPDQVYSIGSAYLQSVEECRSLADVDVHANNMFEDFVRRVRQTRQQDGLTKQIRACCLYINFHVEEKLELLDLSTHVGYTPYYLSRKFREEVGVSVNDYIKRAKIERAKLLLTTTEDSIQAIAERLNFSSRSFFADTFRLISGQSPARYRAENQKL